MTDKLYVIASYEDESNARMVHEFLKSFHLYTRYGGKVVHMETKDWLRNSTEMRFCLVLPDSVKRYTTTLDKMSSALSDFWKGYNRAMTQVEALTVKRLKECTSDMVGEPIGDPAKSESFWVTKVTRDSITLSRKPPKRCKDYYCQEIVTKSRDYCPRHSW